MAFAPTAARRNVTVFDARSGEQAGTATLPAVFTAPMRLDVVRSVHDRMAMNSRQAYAVSPYAGHQTSATSWGTGRAVSRIPRVGGGGTGRSGQGAFGNMCRGGRMFAPTKIYRKWHRKINTNERRYAVASALAASAVPALVMARGHKVDEVPEMPLVLSNVEDVKKTKEAVEILKRFGGEADVERVRASRTLRAGKGKSRNRRFVQRRGPLVIYESAEGVQRAFRNLPGVELCHVDRLNLLQLAPGGTMGRFCVWTKDAFEKLERLFGSYEAGAELKKNYHLPRHMMANGDLARVINSSEVQEVVTPAVTQVAAHGRKRNPLRNRAEMAKLNPHFETFAANSAEAAKKAASQRSAALKAKRAARKASTKDRRARYAAITGAEYTSVQ